MEQELRDALGEIRDDIKRLLPLQDVVKRHELAIYGNGHDGLLTTVEQLKTTHRVYNKILGALGAVVMAVFGDAFWRHVK